jgi:predicted ATPase
VPPSIKTPDQRLRVFVSSTLEELAAEREAVRGAIEALRLTPVMFELGARRHPPADVYRAYLEQSDVFVGIYGERYGWVGPGMAVSGVEDEYHRAAGKPRLVYVKNPAPAREPRLSELIANLEHDASITYKTFRTPAELRELLENDLAVLLTEGFVSAAGGDEPIRATIPASVDEFVGRSGELRRIAELLDQGTRLITVVGPGGVGKTRLAQEAARQSRDRFQDGAAFVSLDAVTDPTLVAPAIVSSLTLRSDPASGPLDTLVEHLRERTLLLVLDNFEQVLEAAPVVADLLARCGDVSVLVTSRAALRLRGEQEVGIEPLDVPETSDAPNVVAEVDAVRLFTERARRLDPWFHISSENAAAVAQLCRRLDGLPLALELAAARIRLFPPATMLERLGTGLDFLTGGPRDAPPRHRCLRAAIEWSFDLLDEPEQALLTQACVFRGSWNLEAAEGIVDPDAARRLESLLEHSLLKRLSGAAEPRFAMLESIHAFCAEQLERTGQTHELRHAHARFYLDLVATVTPALHGAGQGAALERLELENDNLRAALSWCLESGRAEAIAAVAPGLMHFWWLRGDLDEGLRWIDAVLAAPGLAEATRARALLARGFLTFWRAPMASDPQVFLEAADAFDAVGDVPKAALARLPLAVLRAGGGDQTSIPELEKSQRVLADAGDDWGALLATNALCWALNALAADAPIGVFEDAVTAAAAAGVEAELATALGNLGRRHVLRGDLDQARLRLVEALRIVRRLRSKTGSAYYASALADVAARRGDHDLAIKVFAAAAASGVASAAMLARERERALAAARERLGDHEVDELERAGAELDLATATEEALAWAEC